MTLKIAGLIVIAVAAFGIQAQAHHSFAMFDHEKLITVSGTLKEFEWTNPHCWLHVSAVDATTGRSVDWAFEMGSVGQVAAQGWITSSVKSPCRHPGSAPGSQTGLPRHAPDRSNGSRSTIEKRAVRGQGRRDRRVGETLS